MRSKYKRGIVFLTMFFILNFWGVIPRTEIVGWDWCIEEGHPFFAYIYTLGFPIKYIEISFVYGCLSTPNIFWEIDHAAPYGDLAFWITVIWIVSKIPEGSRREEKK